VLKAFIFDLGNVLLLFSHDRMYAQVAELCGRDASDVRRAFLSDDLGTRFERGECSEAELQIELERRIGARFERDDLHRAIADIFTPNEDMLRFVDALREQGYQLVLLSNTNSIHIRWIESQYDVLSKFDACVLSHEVRAMKPEPAIYAAAIERAITRSRVFYTDISAMWPRVATADCRPKCSSVRGFREQISRLVFCPAIDAATS
jgi:putative hydrolase of the HAD superfamily